MAVLAVHSVKHRAGLLAVRVVGPGSRYGVDHGTDSVSSPGRWPVSLPPSRGTGPRPPRCQGRGQVIREPPPGTVAERSRGCCGQRRLASLVVPPPAGELAAAGAAVDDLDRGGRHALGGGAAGGPAQL